MNYDELRQWANATTEPGWFDPCEYKLGKDILALLDENAALRAAVEEFRVHRLLDEANQRQLERVSQLDPTNCHRCTFVRTEPHLHPGDKALGDAP